MATLNVSKGLVTSSSEINRPDGALTVADNCIIDFDNLIQSRRGFKEYSTAASTSAAKQLFTYKNRILEHYASTMAFDSNGAGVFTPFAGSYYELKAGLRIKAVEANGNFYFTTTDGVKKISVKDAASLATALITNAGGIKAFDLQGKLLPDAAGFLPAQSKVAYRIVYGTKDANSNLILGYPSPRTVLTNSASDSVQSEIFTVNFLTYSTIVDGDYFLFDTPTEGYFAWFNKSGTGTVPINANTLDRTAIEVNIKTATSNDTAAILFANALQNALPTEVTTKLSTTEVEVTITVTGECVDASQGSLASTKVRITKVIDGSKTTGTPSLAKLIFTLPASLTTDYFYQIYRTGTITVEDIGQTLSDIDPGDEQQFVYEAPITAADILAKEITVEDNTPETFRQSGAYLSTNQFSGQGISQANETPPICTDIALFRNSTFYSNTKEVHRLSLSVLSVDNFVSGSTKFYVKQGSTSHTYTFVGDVEITDITVDTTTNTVASSTIYLNSANNERAYYLWFDKTGTNADPVMAGKYGIKVPLHLYPNTIDGTRLAITEALALNTDFIAVNQSTNKVRITCTDSGNVTNPSFGVSPGGAWAVSVFAEGSGEDAATRKALLSVSSSLATSIDLTVRSLVRVINKDSSSPVFAQYISGTDDLPGKIVLEAKSLQDVDFYVAISDLSLVAEFTPEVPYWNGTGVFPITNASDNNEAPNRIYFSKVSQPEAVPSVNYIDVGSKDKQILRILPLRDNLFVLKQDGVYIVTGATAPDFSVRLLDNSATLTAPDSAVVLNNLIYCLTTQGVVSISETGVSIVSRNIEDQIKKVSTFSYAFSTLAFGVAYESDRSYLLWLPTLKSDTTSATQCFRYNTITNTWTRWLKTNTCGIVNQGDDRLYLGSGTNRLYVEQERKDGERQDYADRNFTRTIEDGSFEGNSFRISSVLDVEVGDVIVQTQYVTVPKFNRLLSKLDKDSGPADSNYRASLEVGVGTIFANAILNLVAKLNADANLGTFTTPSGSNDIESLKTDYNLLIDELNGLTSGTNLKTYKKVTSLLTYEVLVKEVSSTSNLVTVNFVPWLNQGDIEIYKGIPTEVEWAPQHFGAPETTKQVDKGTLIFDHGTIYGGTVAYSSDRSANFEEIAFTLSGPGFWASFPWLDSVFGGGGNSVPVITLIPRDKSRCRFLIVRFKHINAREQYKLLGISLEPRE